ncbi:hypothetical protein [Mesorhizobium sp. WSM4313]|uniref:hypothetical protein n=1 Tax=Mesorhizobium sp. WSM4313 TaxID=2029412 RepID=UPI001140EB37|nr:hypothetical protein [Mesorhizobium sp. WSM4313]
MDGCAAPRYSSAVVRMISAISGLLLHSMWKSDESSDRSETAVAALTVAIRSRCDAHHHQTVNSDVRDCLVTGRQGEHEL